MKFSLTNVAPVCCLCAGILPGVSVVFLWYLCSIFAVLCSGCVVIVCSCEEQERVCVCACVQRCVMDHSVPAIFLLCGPHTECFHQLVSLQCADFSGEEVSKMSPVCPAVQSEHQHCAVHKQHFQAHIYFIF